MKTVSLQSAHGKYVCAEVNNTVIANRDGVGPWETWEIEHIDADHVAVKSHHGGYLRAWLEDGAFPKGAVTADRFDPPQGWETWKVEIQSDGRVAFRSGDGVHYLCAESDGKMVTNRTEIGSWETFLPEPVNAFAPDVPAPGPTPPGPIPGNLIKGRLRYRVGGLWEDDNGPVAPLFCHHMSAFSQWCHGKQDRVRAQCERLVARGYHGIRSLSVLGYWDVDRAGNPAGWYGKEVTPIAFTSKSGRHIAATPNYYDLKRSFIQMLHDCGLKLMDDNGDLNGLNEQQILALMRQSGQLYSSMGDIGRAVLAFLQACNESWQNGVPDHNVAARMLQAFKDGAGWLPDSCGLSWGAKDNNWHDPVDVDPATGENRGGDPTGEMPDSMMWWSIAPATVITMHGARLGWAHGEHLIAHYLGYSWYDDRLREYGKRTLNSEPVGGDAHHDDEVTNGAIHDPERIAGIHLECLMTGQAATFMSGAGVWGEREIDGEPGFDATANLLRWLPRDMHTFDNIGHASRSSAILRDDKPAQHHTRADYAIHADGRFVMHVYSDGNPHYAMPFARPVSECKVIDVVNNRVQSEGPRQVGQRFTEQFTWSRLVIGKLA